MKIKQLLIATGFLAVFALVGCEAQKPIEAVAEPAVVTEAAPVVAEPAVVAPAPVVKEHGDKHHSKAKGAHNCTKHCKKHKKAKKDKVCKAHCEKKAQ